MGGAKPPSPMGAMMNQEMAQKMQGMRSSRMNMLSQQDDELFATLLRSGQSPYRSPYEPEAFNDPMSDQNFGPFG
jgi:hypothetical protein